MFTGVEEIKMEFLICYTSTFLLGINNLLQELKFEKEAHGNISQNEHHSKERNTSGKEDFLTKEIDALKDSLNRSHKNAEQFALNFLSYTFLGCLLNFLCRNQSKVLLQYLEQVMKILTDLSEWLTRQEEGCSRQQPLGGDLQTLKCQRKELQVVLLLHSLAVPAGLLTLHITSTVIIGACRNATHRVNLHTSLYQWSFSCDNDCLLFITFSDHSGRFRGKENFTGKGRWNGTFGCPRGKFEIIVWIWWVWDARTWLMTHFITSPSNRS